MHLTAATIVCILFIIGVSSQWLAWRLKLPAIILLLLFGVLFGEGLQWVGIPLIPMETLLPGVSLSVAIILFEGSLNLKFHDIAGYKNVIRNLVSVGVLISLVLTAIATHYLLNFSWSVSLLFGSIMAVTGPTVIAPMIRTVLPKTNLANILLWEGILLDAIGAILAVFLFELITSTGGNWFLSGMLFAELFVTGTILGIAGGYLFGLVLKRYWIPHYLHNFATLAYVCTIFTVSNLIESDSGLLTVTIMGVWLTNTVDVHLEEILNFEETMSLILISILFIMLASHIDVLEFVALGLPAVLLFIAIQFIIRPLSVLASTYGSKLSLREKALLCWIAPRGIVAAAIASLFALKLEIMHFPEAEKIVPLTFLIIFATVILQSITARWVALKLKVADPEPKGFLILGADSIAQSLALELMRNDIMVRLVDLNWADIYQANLKGIPTYWGNIVSEHAKQHLALQGLGNFITLTPFKEMNALALKNYRTEFGPAHIYTISTRDNDPINTNIRRRLPHGARELFQGPVYYAVLNHKFEQGYQFKTTTLTDKFTIADYLHPSQGERLPLFAIDPNGSVFVYTHTTTPEPKKGWKIIGLSSP
ncbi:cation:proton antiporter [Legionella sp. W05-934-2]|jgi:CPA1 family monovalent cation:H+ antiporter|uniref:cation:proton antiporter n=1 Tax=Legionella sp. W05-934-2 TaxID=1198649 RepID=UPI003461A4A7